MFEHSFVKLVPSGTFWTACFHPVDPVIDVDIVLPVQWNDDNTVEEVDLELDILRSRAGSVRVRDQDAFLRVQEAEAMPEAIVTCAETTCEHIRAQVEQGAEPFGTVGHAWLPRFLAQVDAGHQ